CFSMCFRVICTSITLVLFLSSRRRHTRFSRDWSSDVCSSDLEQERLIDRIVHALDGAGALLMRVGNPAAGWRHAFTQAVDRTIWALRGHPFDALHCRDVDAWIALLRRHGLRVDAAPMHQGTPFANVLLIARRH